MSKSKKRVTKRNFVNPQVEKNLAKRSLCGYAIVPRVVYDVVRRGTKGLDEDKVVATAGTEGDAEAVIRDLFGGCNGYNRMEPNGRVCVDHNER